MQIFKKLHNVVALIGMVALLNLFQQAPFPRQAGDEPYFQTEISQPAPARAETLNTYTLYLPFIAKRFPLVQPFGLESHSSFQNSTVLEQTQALNIGWTRLGARISWRVLQPTKGGPILWDQLAAFEDELRQLKSAGIEPVVVVYHTPDWALMPGVSAYCGPVAADKFDDFGAFIAQLAARYGQPEFGVTNWEIGNEIDVDPQLVTVNSGFGCWGDMDDPYYGGRYYGQMLKVVTPMIRAKLPTARIWLGGLLLDRPKSSGDLGYSERFLEGVLLAGAARYFDVVPYHWYPSFFRYPCATCVPERLDYDVYANSNWVSWGGGTRGKALFLKAILAKYGISKPLSLNETALGCPEWLSVCASEPPNEFLQAQADFAVRSGLRAINAGVSSYSWFMIKDPSWRLTGLLDPLMAPKPVATAYQTLIDQYHAGIFRGAVAYGTGIEGYAIERDQDIVHVVWTIEDEIRTIKLPASRLLAIYSRDGVSIPLPAPRLDGYIYYNVSFSSTYFHLAP